MHGCHYSPSYDMTRGDNASFCPNRRTKGCQSFSKRSRDQLDQSVVIGIQYPIECDPTRKEARIFRVPRIRQEWKMTSYDGNPHAGLQALITRAPRVWKRSACGVTRSETAIPALVHTDAYAPTTTPWSRGPTLRQSPWRWYFFLS